MKPAVVVPSNRPQLIVPFLRAWEREFAGSDVIVVEDGPVRSFELGELALDVHHYAWTDIDAEMGDLAWIIPRRSGCVRAFGFLKAAQLGASVIITLDDDCLPVDGELPFVETHRLALQSVARQECWVSTGRGTRVRGLPYRNVEREMPVAINHGLWTGTPDFDAVTELQVGGDGAFDPVTQVIPRGTYFPMSSMNVAFRAELLPAFYFLLMGRDYAFDRFGDIWCGIFAKRVCDHLGWAVTSGGPMVHHSRASDVWSNLQKEAAGLKENERVWAAADGITLASRTVKECYLELAEQLPLDGAYWEAARRAMAHWANQF